MTTMTQCRLERDGSYQVTWIETKFAKVGRVVDLDEPAGRDCGWKVAKIGSTMDAKVVAARERDYRNHRKATDV